MDKYYDDEPYILNAEDYCNLYANPELRTILEGIAAIREPNRQYRICQILISAINIQFLKEKRGVILNEYNSDIICIDQEYMKFDEDLSDLTTKINGLYNIYDEQGTVDLYDVEYLLYQVDELYAIMVERYGGIGKIPSG